jgi:hypothetical protein
MRRYRHTCPECGVRHTCQNRTDPSHPLARNGFVHYVACPQVRHLWEFQGQPINTPATLAIAMSANRGALPRRLQPNNTRA